MVWTLSRNPLPITKKLFNQRIHHPNVVQQNYDKPPLLIHLMDSLCNNITGVSIFVDVHGAPIVMSTPFTKKKHEM